MSFPDAYQSAVKYGSSLSRSSCDSLPPTPGRTASPRHCVSWDPWSARCSHWTGSTILICGAQPARSRTKARPATAPGACSLHSSSGRNPRPHIQESAAPCLRSQSSRTAIILWNTRYLERAVTALRQTEDVPDHLLTHLSPLGWEHVNRRLRLGHHRTDDGKPRRISSAPATLAQTSLTRASNNAGRSQTAQDRPISEDCLRVGFRSFAGREKRLSARQTADLNVPFGQQIGTSLVRGSTSR
jgi:hypothetical protein